MNKKDGNIASETQQGNSLCLAVKPPPFDKGGKGVGDFRGIVRFFDRLKSDRVFLSDLFLYAFKIPFGSILEGRTFFVLRVAVKAKLSGIIGDRVIFKSGKSS